MLKLYGYKEGVNNNDQTRTNQIRYDNRNEEQG